MRSGCVGFAVVCLASAGVVALSNADLRLTCERGAVDDDSSMASTPIRP